MRVRLGPGFRLGLLTLVLCLVSAPAPADDAEVAAVLKGFGIRPVEPPSPARDFRLPALDGSETSLSERRGSWVLLTFFATWCGPCATEMPALERLAAEFGGKGLSVLGVSVDSSRESVVPFLERLGVSFPVVWDSEGRAARDYRASSIPVSYLIDPQGLIVGMSRGSRDWAALGGMMERLLGLVPASQELPSLYAAPGSSVDLPIKLTPPSATVSLPAERVAAGKPFYLDVRIVWAGSFDDYMLHPPEVKVPEAVELRGMSAETSSEEGRNVLTYRMTLASDEAGSYALDPVELRYTPRFEATPVASRVPGPTVVVQARTILGLAPAVFGVTSSGLTLAGLLALAARRRLRSSKAAPSERAETPFARLEAAFERARRGRLQGDVAGFLEALSEIDGELGGPAGAGDDLSKAVELARFGGRAPSPEQLDVLQRRIERRLGELRPDARRVERDEIQLADSASRET